MREQPLNPPSRFDPYLNTYSKRGFHKAAIEVSLSLAGALLRFGPGSGNSIEAGAGYVRAAGDVEEASVVGVASCVAAPDHVNGLYAVKPGIPGFEADVVRYGSKDGIAKPKPPNTVLSHDARLNALYQVKDVARIVGREGYS